MRNQICQSNCLKQLVESVDRIRWSTARRREITNFKLAKLATRNERLDEWDISFDIEWPESASPSAGDKGKQFEKKGVN